MREFSVADCLVRPDRNLIVREHEEIHIEPRVMDLLVYLAERPGEVLSPDRMIADVWPHIHVSDSALLTAISALRKAFRDSPRRPAIIETIPKRGYRLIARTSARRAALAVLPMRNISGETDQAYFADGMTEALISELGRIRSLRVISRQSVMTFRDSDRPLPSIAGELGAGLVVEGSVLLTERRVRISARLIDVADDSQVWSEDYESDIRDVLAVQREISVNIAQAISRQLISNTESPMKHREVEPDAMIACLRGRFHFYKFTPAHLERAQQHFEDAIGKDPTFASAHACMADLWGAYGYWGFRPAREVRDKVHGFITKALAIDPDDAEANAILGAYLFYVEHDFAAAESRFVRAITLNPSLLSARLLYCLFLATTSRREALDQFDIAVKLDPLNPAILFAQALWLSAEGRMADIEDCIRLMLDIEPGYPPALELMADLYWRDDPEAALALEIEARQGDPVFQAALELVPPGCGPREVMRAVADAMRERSRQSYMQPRQIARVLAHAGETDAALDCLEQAVANDDLFQIDFMAMSPAWVSLYDEPRYRAILAGMGLRTARE